VTRVADILGNTVLRQGQDLLLAVDDGRIAGVVSAEDIAWALELAALGVYNVAA